VVLRLLRLAGDGATGADDHNYLRLTWHKYAFWMKIQAWINQQAQVVKP
jgi:hypothetical protein